jgi:hypothetical protein
MYQGIAGFVKLGLPAAGFRRSLQKKKRKKVKIKRRGIII